MTITFFSNFLNDHQLPFCQEVISHIGEDNFHFVATSQIDPDRIEMGFEDMNNTRSFVVRAYENEKNLKYAHKLMIESDVVIIGSAQMIPYKARLEKNKLTFRYNERILKRGDIHILDPRVIKDVYNRWTRYRHSHLYTLCASAYTARDLSLFGYPKSKCFKWGYFPMNKQYENVDALIEKKYELKHRQDVSILWVGRLIGWKHPEYPLLIAKRLKCDGYKFNVRIIGAGPMKDELKHMIKISDVEDCVTMVGALTPEEVRLEMEKSQVFLFTSDKNEGWGAVLNESMNSACAVVANKTIGSVPFLVINGINALSYNNTVEDAYRCAKKLMDNESMRRSMGKEAYNTICNVWSAKNAASNFMNLIESLSNNLLPNIQSGPCSNIK